MGELSAMLTERALLCGKLSPSSLYSDTSPKGRAKLLYNAIKKGRPMVAPTFIKFYFYFSNGSVHRRIINK